MAIVTTNIYKGITLQQEADKTKKIVISPSASATTATSTTIQAAQTADRVITLPDATTVLLGETNSATVTNKIISAVSNSIVTAASGNLTSTELNSSLNELQLDIDTRATSAALTSHTGASSGVHGVTGSVVGTTDAQAITGKTLLEVDLVRLDGSTIDVTSGSLTLSAGAGGTVVLAKALTPNAADTINIGNSTDRFYYAHMNALVLYSGALGQSMRLVGTGALTPSGASFGGIEKLSDVGGTHTGMMTANNAINDSSSTSGIYLETGNKTVGGGNSGSITLQTGTAVGTRGNINLNAPTVAVSTNLTVGGNATITGDLTVQGTTVTMNTSTVDVEDKNITLNKGGNDASSVGAGITIERTSTFGSLLYDSTLTSKWKAGALGSEVELVTVSGAQAISGKTQLDVDNIRLDGNTISSTNSNGNLTLDPNGTGYIEMSAPTVLTRFDETQTGANQTLSKPANTYVKLTGALTSIAGVAAGTDGQVVVYSNVSGGTLTVRNESASASGATARILTGTGADLDVANNATIILIYESGASRWRMVGGSGSGGGGGSVLAITPVSADYTALTTDEVILVTAGGADRTITLLAPASNNKKIFRVKKVDSNAGQVILSCSGTFADTGGSTLTLSNQYDTVTVVADSATSSYYIV